MPNANLKFDPGLTAKAPASAPSQVIPPDKRDEEEWSEEELRRVFSTYKECGSKWSKIADRFPGRTDNDLKNKFYSTLKKVATLAQLENPNKYDSDFLKCKRNLLQFIDLAILHGFNLSSKRGRKNRDERQSAKEKPLLFPSRSQAENLNRPPIQQIKGPKTIINSTVPNLSLLSNSIPVNIFWYYPFNTLGRNYTMNTSINGQGNNRFYGIPDMQGQGFPYDYEGI